MPMFASKGGALQHGSSLPISDLSTHIILKNADLRLQPLKFGMAGGSIAANIHLEGDKKPIAGAGRYSGSSTETERTDARCGTDAEDAGGNER